MKKSDTVSVVECRIQSGKHLLITTGANGNMNTQINVQHSESVTGVEQEKEIILNDINGVHGGWS
ncbi:MAG: hypothetical protein MRZ79_22555 [Bacteroidia bacterium]|nr:hypothetical protein [Bacteroidia bacterium]